MDFDLKLIDLFRKMEEGKRKGHDAVVHEYNRVKELLQHVPTRVELFTHMVPDLPVYNFLQNQVQSDTLFPALFLSHALIAAKR